MTHSFPTRRSSDLVGVVQIHRLHRFDDQARIAIGHKAAQPFRRYVLQLPGYRDIATIRAIASCTGGVLDDVGHSSLPFLSGRPGDNATSRQIAAAHRLPGSTPTVSPETPPVCRSEEHTSELQSLMRISYAVFCLKKKKLKRNINIKTNQYKSLTEIS